MKRQKFNKHTNIYLSNVASRMKENNKVILVGMGQGGNPALDWNIKGILRMPLEE